MENVKLRGVSPFFLALSLLAPAVGSSSTITINFDGLTQGTVLNNTYQSSSVLFSDFTEYTTTASGELLFGGTGWAAASGCDVTWTDVCGTITFVDPLNPTIPEVTDLVSWDTLGVVDSLGGISGFTITAYDLLGNAIGTPQTFDGGFGPLAIETQSVSAAGIHQLVITGRTDGGALGFDNLSFDDPPPTVPEPEVLFPASLGLLMIGLSKHISRRVRL